MTLTQVKALVNKINKAHGDGTIILGADLRSQKIERCTTGVLSFDYCLGGGWPLNQWHEIIGNESSGKTAVALRTVAANQARDPKWTCAWVAAESLPIVWAQKFGVDLDRFLIIDTNVMEYVYTIVDELVDDRAVDCVVIDSLPALVPLQEDEKANDGDTVGVGAKRTAQFFRKVGKASKRSLTETDRPFVGIVINQWRERIGVMYGDPRTTPGGKAKNFAYFTRIEVKRKEWVSEGGKKIGQRIEILSHKNKSAPGQRDGSAAFYFDDGGPSPAGSFDTLDDIVNLGLANGVITRPKGFYVVGDDPICKARADLIPTLRTNDVLRQRIERQVLGLPEPKATKKVSTKSAASRKRRFSTSAKR